MPVSESHVCEAIGLSATTELFTTSVADGNAQQPANVAYEYMLHASLGSVGEESYSETLDVEADAEDGPELNVDSINRFIGSIKHRTSEGVPKAKVIAQVSGTGLAPWEIHRPQRFVRDLVLRRCFSGRVLDAGCGIGDNALYVAKACPAAQVVAVDVVPRCLDFANTKAGLRGLRGKLAFVAADLRDYDGLPYSPVRQQQYDIVLDSSTFHVFPDPDRERYVATLQRLIKRGGLVYMNCMSEEETRPGGPRRISPQQLSDVFNPCSGWQVESAEDSIVELHPTFWGGRARARLFTIRRL